jgi:ribosomal protein S18 acetylase RimI-like enzyme
VVIRDARAGEREAVLAVTLAAFQEYATAMPDLWPPYRDNIIATLDDPSPAQQLVAEEAGRILGAVLLYPPGTLPARAGDPAPAAWPEVRLLAVPPEARGRGTGAALMRECMRRVRASGLRVLTLHTTDLMQAALRLYERLGFVRAPELDFTPAPGVTVKGYRLDLAAAEGTTDRNEEPR